MRVLVTCLMLGPIAPARAQELSIDLDPQKTRIAFVLTDVLHTVRGDFRLREGHLSFNSATTALSGEIVVDAASGNSGSAARDKRMRRDILEAQRFPEIRFSPTLCKGPVTASGTSDVQVSGSFVIHGDAHNIVIPMRIQISRKELVATGKFIVPYVQWGMKNPSNFLLKVSDKVEINLTAVGAFR
jgi:polyisoprenoid-binding protein YceI